MIHPKPYSPDEFDAWIDRWADEFCASVGSDEYTAGHADAVKELKAWNRAAWVDMWGTGERGGRG